MTSDLVKDLEPDLRSPQQKLEQAQQYLASLREKWPNAENEIIFREVPVGQLSRDEMVILLRRELEKQRVWREEDNRRADEMYQELLDAAHPPKENQ